MNKPAPAKPQLTSAQQAARTMNQQNKMQLKIGAPAADGAEDCEVYGGEYPEVDIDQINQQALLLNQQSKASSHTVILDREIQTEPINFQSSIAKFTQVSNQEIEHRNAVKRSRQAVIAGRLLRIRGEMKMMEDQLKANEQQQSQASNDITDLEQLKGKLEDVCRMQGF